VAQITGENWARTAIFVKYYSVCIVMWIIISTSDNEGIYWGVLLFTIPTLILLTCALLLTFSPAIRHYQTHLRQTRAGGKH
jgi:hypothetical protein